MKSSKELPCPSLKTGTPWIDSMRISSDGTGDFFHLCYTALTSQHSSGKPSPYRGLGLNLAPPVLQQCLFRLSTYRRSKIYGIWICSFQEAFILQFRSLDTMTLSRHHDVSTTVHFSSQPHARLLFSNTAIDLASSMDYNLVLKERQPQHPTKALYPIIR